VDFDLSDDQAALRDAAHSLLERYASIDRLRARVGDGTVVGTLPGAGQADGVGGGGVDAGGDAPRGFDRELWAAMSEQGWLAVELPEDDGGLGWGMVEVAVLCEQLGRYVAPAPFLPTVLALDAVRSSEAGAGDGRLSKLVESLAAGEAVGCVSFSQQPSRADHGVTAEVSGGDKALLTGRTAPVPYAPSADIAVVVTYDGVFGVLREDASTWATPESAMDRTRELGRLVFDGTPAVTLGGPDAVTRLLDRAATATSAEMLGVADHAMNLAVDYAKDRVQFGKPIGSFQAVKHRLADALVDVEGMRSTVYYAAWCTAVGNPESSLAASMAKSWCSDASRRVLASALQVHGGIGFTWEHPLHLYLKRGQLDQVSFGDGAWHRDRIAELLRTRVDEGSRIF
jgi:alkylation response protein AidB-like acyl-CoA dehydrogenase